MPLAVLLVAGLLLALAAPPASAAPRIVPPGRTLVVPGQAVEPAVSGSMDGYARALGRQPAGFMFYEILSGDVARTARELATIEAFLDRQAGRRGPRAVLQLGLGLGPALTGNARETTALLAGAYDAELRLVGRWLRSLDRVVLLRPLYEFDRPGGTYGPPELFRRGYRRMVDRIRASGARNVRFVWHSAGPAFGTAEVPPIRRSYPGRRHVDLFGISWWGDNGADPGSAVAQLAYRRAIDRTLRTARALGLPAMIAESTPAFIGTTSGPRSVRWLRETTRLVRRHDVRVLSIISAPWASEGGVWSDPLFRGFFPADSRLEADPEVWAAWRRLTRGPRWLHTAASADRVLRFRARPVPLRLGAGPEPTRARLRWPACTSPDVAGSGGWCLPPLP